MAILRFYQVGVPSKHAQNEDEKHLSTTTAPNAIQMDELAICIQDSVPPGYKRN